MSKHSDIPEHYFSWIMAAGPAVHLQFVIMLSHHTGAVPGGMVVNRVKLTTHALRRVVRDMRREGNQI